MSSISKSKKGVETAPLFIIFAAVVMIVTAGIVYDTFNKWSVINDKGRTLSEAKRIAQVCEDIKYMGDQGSVQEINIVIPEKCRIIFGSKGPAAHCDFGSETYDENAPCNAKLKPSSGTIPAGSTKITVINSASTAGTAGGSFVIYVS